MNRLLGLAAVAAAVGASLVLAEWSWFRRGSLADRLAPYLPGSTRTRRPRRVLSWWSLREIVTPLAAAGGNRLSHLFGVGEELGLRLERIHAPFTASAYRMRQLGVALGALAGATLLAAAVGPPLVITVVFLVGAPVLAFLVLEQQVARASARWQAQLRGELPVVTEQLGMLLGAGYSLASALNRLSQRGSGACATDLVRVCGRMRQGLGEQVALAEWAELADVDALDRLVSVLALNRQATDLGRLIAEESRSMRRDAQRRLIESIERRGQQVWVPVTVAALVPGVLFLAVPFVQAMRLFTAT